MEKKGVLTKILAAVGTALVWFPLLAPVLLTTAAILTSGRFLFDYLMPAELFLFALGGGILLIWAAWRAHSRRALIAWALGLATGLLVFGQAFAVLTGMASGEADPTTWWRIVLMGSLLLYSFALIALGAGGILLLRDLFKASLPPAAGA